MMNSTFGAPAFARSGAGHAGVDSAIVRPRLPGNAVPGLYSRNDIQLAPVTVSMGSYVPLLCGTVIRDAPPGSCGLNLCTCCGHNVRMKRRRGSGWRVESTPRPRFDDNLERYHIVCCAV